MTTSPELLAEIKWLREKTGYAAMECREALLSAGGDRERAKKILRDKIRKSMKQSGGVLDLRTDRPSD